MLYQVETTRSVCSLLLTDGSIDTMYDICLHILNSSYPVKRVLLKAGSICICTMVAFTITPTLVYICPHDNFSSLTTALYPFLVPASPFTIDIEFADTATATSPKLVSVDILRKSEPLPKQHRDWLLQCIHVVTPFINDNGQNDHVIHSKQLVSVIRRQNRTISDYQIQVCLPSTSSK